MPRSDGGAAGGRPEPDFLIVGAMKCGTTSLYSSLTRHPGVYMPDREVGFFDIDDIRQHPDFFKHRDGEWNFHRYGTRQSEVESWYAGLFEGAEPGQVVGERSTTYMASSLAPERIHETNPDARLIFMMRDPVRRAYSNYWHLLRDGEATASFEKTLRYRPSVLFDRGLYREQIERYLRFFPREQLLFLVFEDYIRDPVGHLERVCRFIGADPDALPEREEDRHENRGRYPWSRRLQYFCNAALFQGVLDGQRYLDAHLPALQSEEIGYGRPAKWAHRGLTLAYKAISRLNCSRRKKPEIRPETRDLLKYLYEERNAGLGELIDEDLSESWPVTDPARRDDAPEDGERPRRERSGRSGETAPGRARAGRGAGAP